MTDREIDDCWREEREGRKGGREREGEEGREGAREGTLCMIVY